MQLVSFVSTDEQLRISAHQPLKHTERVNGVIGFIVYIGDGYLHKLKNRI